MKLTNSAKRSSARMLKVAAAVPLTALLIVATSSTATARYVEGASDVKQTTAPMVKNLFEGPITWQAVKTEVSTWWNGLNAATDGAGRKPASADPAIGNVAVEKTATRAPALPIAAMPGVEVLKTQQAAVPADSSLKKSRVGVPIFDLMVNGARTSTGGRGAKTHVAKIPLLNVGIEQSLVAHDFEVPNLHIFDVSHLNLKELLSLPLTSEKEINVLVVSEQLQAPLKLTLSFLEGEQVVNRERVDGVKWDLTADPNFVPFAYKAFSAEDYLALKAFIFFDKKDQCHVSTGFLYSLLESKNQPDAMSANLDLGTCLKDMGLFTESTQRLSEVVRHGSKEQVTKAIDKLVIDLPLEFEEEVAKALKKVDPVAVSEKAKDSFHYVLAKGAALTGDFHASETYAALVSKNFPKYDQAQYLLAVAEYVNGQVDQSIRRQKELLDRADRSAKQADLVSLVAMNLGRTSFQNKNYEEAANYFMKIRKDNSFWVNALTEQGWAQLQKSDAEGAIGNMYSIHSPYFKAVYKPDSYVVRTIGYLNLCQYGDAYRTLSQLETLYRPWNESMKGHIARNVSPAQMYSELVTFLRAPASALTASTALPAPVMREIGHSRDYLNMQQAINSKVDESDQFGFVTNLIDKDKDKLKWRSGKAQQRILDDQALILRSEKETGLIKNVAEWKAQIALDRDYIEFFRFKSSVLDESKRGMIRFRDFAKVKLNNAKEELKISAGKVLLKHLANLQTELASILDNNELLRYETFAGSGENIRFHMGEAGNTAVAANTAASVANKKGDMQRRVAAEVKPKSKSLQWDFDGEYWEDEIGNYRSSLKNNCPKSKASAMNAK